MIDTYLWIALLMFFGVWLLLWRKKRKFDRLNKQGIEAFESYPKKVKAEVFDTLLFLMGYVSLISGLFALITID